ncbi:MAG TPA: hypothetical protein DCL35_04935 [Candidatus Omnitrophica bacterium]|nr:hypothetical protein [Candidatus Omnitrophota bacterium]
MSRTKRYKFEILKSDAQAKEDGRVFCRFALDSVPMRFKDLKIGEKGSAVALDIGGGGAGIESARELKPRTPLELWFDLPDGYEPMHLLGKVVWSQLSGAAWKVGVSFDRPRLMSLSRILKVEKDA